MIRAGLRETWLSAARGEGGGIGGTVLLTALAPLEALYRCGLAGYLAAERAGLRKRASLGARVVSIGNLTLGGTGKTGAAESIARNVSGSIKTAVLLRGYGGRKSNEGIVVSDGSGLQADWRDCGDEAALLADSLPGVAVIAGKDRLRSGSLAIDKFGAELILLDDGLQYWQLKRDRDIILVDARCPFGNSRVMPGGLLREPVGGLKRAGAVIVTHSHQVSADELNRLKGLIFSIVPGVSIHEGDYQAISVRSPDGRCLPVESIRGSGVAMLSGIGSPDSFAATLAASEARVVCRMDHPDHHPFTQRDIDLAVKAAKDASAEYILITRKDAVRMKGLILPDNLLTLEARMVISDLEKLTDIVRGG